MSEYRGIFFEPEILNEIRERFIFMESDPISGKRIYLENAGGTLTLKKVVELAGEYTSFPDNSGRSNSTSRKIDEVMTRGIEDIKTLIGASSGVIALGESTTANAFKALTSIIFNVPGENVVTTDLDHPAVYDASKILADRFNKEWRVAGLSRSTGMVDHVSVLKHIDSRTIVLALIHSSNTVGTKNDIKTIIRKARDIKPDLFVLVDGAQYGSHTLIDVDDLGCDIYLVSSYKMYSKSGASALYLSDRASKLPHDRLEGKPGNYWELGTREPAGYAAWSAVVDYLCWLGRRFKCSEDKRELILTAFDAIGRHEWALTNRMLYGSDKTPGMVKMRNVTIAGEVHDLQLKDPVFLFCVKGKDTAEVVAEFEKSNIRVHNRVSDAYSRYTLEALGIEEGVRVSACHYTSPQEVDVFLNTLQRIAE